MKLINKYVIGTHVMFYEIEILHEFVDSVIQASNETESTENIIVDIFFNMSEYFEKIEPSKIDYIRNTFLEEIDKLNESGVNVNYKIYNSEEPYTMTNYRRELNFNYCNSVDYVIWGETDCLVPKEMFLALEQIKEYANSQNIHRYITTFATRKMWDDSWKVLEHPKFTNCKYLERDDTGAFTEPHSIRYVMSLEEMNDINSEADEFELQILQQPKFDGSILVMSADLLKMGVNIPPGFFGLSAEDTAFMYDCMQRIGSSYIQFVVKNILKVHNRDHHNKREYALDKLKKNTFSTQKTKGDWYTLIRDMNKHNLELFIGQKQDKFLSYADYEEKLKEL